MNLEELDIEKLLKETKAQPLSAGYLAQLETAMLDCLDTQELRSVEAELVMMEPSMMEHDYLENSAARMDLSPVEQELEKIELSPITNDLFARLENAMDCATEKSEAKIVEMVRESSGSKGIMKYISSAAAVVVATTAWMLMSGGNRVQQNAAVAIPKDTQEEVFTLSDEDTYTNKKLSHSIVQASNAGVLSHQQRPYKIVRVIFEEIVSFTGEDGKKYEKRVPQEKLFMVPVKTN